MSSPVPGATWVKLKNPEAAVSDAACHRANAFRITVAGSVCAAYGGGLRETALKCPDEANLPSARKCVREAVLEVVF
jgi:hypothetical protein